MSDKGQFILNNYPQSLNFIFLHHYFLSMKSFLRILVVIVITHLVAVACVKRKPQVTRVEISDEYRKAVIDSFRRVDSIRKVKEEAFKKAPKTTVKFLEETFDFGKIKSGDVVSHKFQFVNTGTNPLLINSAHGSCGCTVPSYPEEPVLPGDTAVMNVEFNSQGKSGTVTKSVTIIANTEPSILELNISANIK